MPDGNSALRSLIRLCKATLSDMSVAGTVTTVATMLATDPLFNVYVPGVVEQRTAGGETRELSPTFGEAMSISTDVATSDAPGQFNLFPHG